MFSSENHSDKVCTSCKIEKPTWVTLTIKSLIPNQKRKRLSARTGWIPLFVPDSLAAPVNVSVRDLKDSFAVVTWDIPDEDPVIGFAITQQVTGTWREKGHKLSTLSIYSMHMFIWNHLVLEKSEEKAFG